MSMRRMAVGLCVGAFMLTLPALAGAAAWSKAQLPGTAGHVFLLGVSCPTSSLCVATGTDNTIASSTDPTGGAGAWNVAHGGAGPSPYIPENAAFRSGRQIQGVSCPSPTLCVAVTAESYIYTSTNPTGPSSAWSTTQIGSNGDRTHLFGVSCPSASLCVAVSGKRKDPGRILTSTNPTGGESAWHAIELGDDFDFRGVSCPSPSLCVAVSEDGRIVTSTEPTGPASSWKVIGAPAGPAGLHAVGCALPSLCVSGSETGNLVATTDPTGGLAAWDPFPGGGTVQITGVSCPSPSQCLAVDDNGGAIASNDPTGGRSAWHYENVIPYTDPPNEGELEDNALFSASCPSSTLCVAVGTSGQIVAKTNPFAVSPAQDKKGGGKKKRKGPRRPHSKVATVRLPSARALHEHTARVQVRFYSLGRSRGFLCSFDGRPFRRCHSPKRYPIGTGKHLFRVRAIGVTGLRGPIAREEIDIPPFCKYPFGPPPSKRQLSIICTR